MKGVSLPLQEETREADVLVVGGGMAGLCAAIAAARHGARTILMHDRPVLGGNASSECRVHICGADRHNSIPHMRETGILEELRLENLRRNPSKSYSLWDLILYEKAKFQPNLALLLNTSCFRAAMDGASLASVTGLQTTTQTLQTVRAKIYIDCSGDAILAPLSGAAFRMGREARDEFGESIAPEKADSKTMGMTCLFQSREYDRPQTFEPPAWARKFDRCEDLPYGKNGHAWWRMGYWWIELGGEHDSIHDTERLRDELLKITLGVWDHIKNRCPHREQAANWALEWLQFLPAKRESRRFVGDHILTQNDIESEGRFQDTVAYGGWSMDDHHPAGFEAVRLGAPATIFHRAPSPYGIPYRCLYSRNVANLMFAGRNASCTHAAMSSTRVMGTACSMGQAVGTAAALCIEAGLAPRQLCSRISRLQQILLQDDAYIPWLKQDLDPLTTNAKLSASQGDPEPVRDGINRQVGNDPHSWSCSPGDWIAYTFDRPSIVTEATLILDSAMDRNLQMSFHQKDDQLAGIPETMQKSFRVDILRSGRWTPFRHVTDNYMRLVRVAVGEAVEGVRVVFEKTWRAPRSRVYAFCVRQDRSADAQPKAAAADTAGRC